MAKEYSIKEQCRRYKIPTDTYASEVVVHAYNAKNLVEVIETFGRKYGVPLSYVRSELQGVDARLVLSVYIPQLDDELLAELNIAKAGLEERQKQLDTKDKLEYDRLRKKFEG